MCFQYVYLCCSNFTFTYSFLMFQNDYRARASTIEYTRAHISMTFLATLAYMYRYAVFIPSAVLQFFVLPLDRRRLRLQRVNALGQCVQGFVVLVDVVILVLFVLLQTRSLKDVVSVGLVFLLYCLVVGLLCWRRWGWRGWRRRRWRWLLFLI